MDIEKDKVKFYPDFLIKDSIRIETGEYDYSYNNFEYQLIKDKNTGYNNNFVAFSPNYYCYTTNDSQICILQKKQKT